MAKAKAKTAPKAKPKAKAKKQSAGSKGEEALAAQLSEEGVRQKQLLLKAEAEREARVEHLQQVAARCQRHRQRWKDRRRRRS